VRAFVALGDSFTAGTGCEPGECWADRLATALDAKGSLVYENLAVEGATSEQVRLQLPRALELEPDLVTVVCGANDVLGTVRPRIEQHRIALDLILGSVRRGLPDTAIITATAPEAWRFLRLRPRTSARVADGILSVNRATREIAAAHGVPCLDVSRHPGLSDPENFSSDGLHPSAIGHRRAAVELARALHDHFGIETRTTGGDRP
jgi:phosphatidylinositol alpha 1,6-mannosyltransferase